PLPSTLFLQPSPAPRDLHSFPTRRSSDLLVAVRADSRHRAALWRVARIGHHATARARQRQEVVARQHAAGMQGGEFAVAVSGGRSEEHTSELQSLTNLVCRLLLEKKKKTT